MPNLRSKTWTTTTPATVNDAQYWEDHLISDEAAQKAAGAVQSVNNTLPDENGNINITPSPLGPTVVDSLNSTSATDALSANMGHELNEKKVDIEQGSENEGKILKVDANGDLVLADDEGGSAWGGITGNIADQTDLINTINTSQSGALSDIKSTVGWDGKNILPITLDIIKRRNTDFTWVGNVASKNNVSYTVQTNSEGFVTGISADTNSQTASENTTLYLANQDDIKYEILRGKTLVLSGGYGTTNQYVECYIASPQSWNRDTDGSGKSITFPDVSSVNFNFNITVKSGETVSNKTFYPMLRDASITDSTFEPYHPPVSEWGYTREEANVLGAKNLLPMNLSALKSDTENTGTWTSNVYNKNNVDFTLNNDLSVTVNTSGASADTQLVLSFDMVAGDYKLNGCADGSDSTYWIDVYNSKWSDRQYNYNGDTDVTFTGTTKRIFRVFVKSGATVSNKTVYPMLRLASDTDNTYAPYAMTNKELTEKASFILGYPSALKTVSNAGSVSVRLSKKIYPSYSNGDSTYLVIAYKYTYGLPTGYLIGFMAAQNASYKYKEIKSDNASDLSLDISTADNIDTITLTCSSAAYMNLAVYKLPLNSDGYDYLP